MILAGSLSEGEMADNKKGTVSPQKAKKILEDGEVRGKKLTKKQRGFFGARFGGKGSKRKT